MRSSSTKCQFNIYGDSFMTKICPLLKKKLKLDIKENLTIAEAEISQLHSTVARKYRQQNRKLGRNDAVLVMVGTYDIMNYKEKSSLKRFGQQICRKLRSFVRFLSKYHKYVIIVTALPVLKIQEKRKYWKLLYKYNSNIARISRSVGTNVRMVDLFPIFVESLEPPRCNQRFYDRFNCPPYDANVTWNYPGMRVALERIRAVDSANPPVSVSAYYHTKMTFTI